MGDSTHDKVMWERPDRQGRIRSRGTPWIDPTHDKVMWRDLTGKADQDSRDPLDLLEYLDIHGSHTVEAWLGEF